MIRKTIGIHIQKLKVDLSILAYMHLMDTVTLEILTYVYSYVERNL